MSTALPASLTFTCAVIVFFQYFWEYKFSKSFPHNTMIVQPCLFFVKNCKSLKQKKQNKILRVIYPNVRKNNYPKNIKKIYLPLTLKYLTYIQFLTDIIL